MRNAAKRLLSWYEGIKLNQKWYSNNEPGQLARSDERPTGDQVAGSILQSGTILLFRLIMTYFQRSITPFR